MSDLLSRVLAYGDVTIVVGSGPKEGRCVRSIPRLAGPGTRAHDETQGRGDTRPFRVVFRTDPLTRSRTYSKGQYPQFG